MPGSDTKDMIHDMLKILVVGAGGLGCELRECFQRDIFFILAVLSCDDDGDDVLNCVLMSCARCPIPI